MSEIYLTPFSPSLGSALAKALTRDQYNRIDRGMRPPMTMTQQEATNFAQQENLPPRQKPEATAEDRQSMYDNIDSMNPRNRMSGGQREFELGQSARSSLGPQNRLIQERNRSPISNISRDVGSAARRGMDRAASSLAPMADAARQRFSDVGQSVSEGAQAAGQAMGRAGAAMGATASNVASQIPGMADAARQRFNQTGEAIGQGARQLGQTIGQGATQARDAMNQGAMNVASKIPGMARAAGRMVGTAGRKFGEAAQTARERMTSPEMREFAATTGEGAGAVMGAAGRGAMAAGRIAGKVAGAAAGAGMEYGAKGTRALGRSGMEYGAKGARALGTGGMNVASKIPGMMGAAGRLLMGTNNPMANQPNSQMNNQGGMNYMQEGFLNAPPQRRSLGQDEKGNPITEQTPDPLRQTYSKLYNQNVDRSQTRGGIGTGVMSNLLTGGLSGLARGAYNKRQRNIGRQNLQNLNQYGLNATPFLRSEYETMRDRTIIRSRMTTEAIRSAYVI